MIKSLRKCGHINVTMNFIHKYEKNWVGKHSQILRSIVEIGHVGNK